MMRAAQSDGRNNAQVSTTSQAFQTRYDGCIDHGLVPGLYYCGHDSQATFNVRTQNAPSLLNRCALMCLVIKGCCWAHSILATSAMATKPPAMLIFAMLLVHNVPLLPPNQCRRAGPCPFPCATKTLCQQGLWPPCSLPMQACMPRVVASTAMRLCSSGPLQDHNMQSRPKQVFGS